MTKRTSLKDCGLPWEWLTVDSSGNACCCCHSRGLIGNLNEAPFDEVWNGPKMLQLRKAISEDKFVPYCKGASCQYAMNRQAEINSKGTPLPPTRRIEFTESGNLLEYTVSGWSPSEATHTWTMGPRAAVKISKLPRGLLPWSKLRIRATSFLGNVRRISVFISMNDCAVGSATFEDAATRVLSFSIPSLIYWKQRDRPIEIAFNIKDPVSPKALGINKDSRELGIAIHWMQLG
jgi:hypothetical protein